MKQKARTRVQQVPGAALIPAPLPHSPPHVFYRNNGHPTQALALAQSSPGFGFTVIRAVVRLGLAQLLPVVWITLSLKMVYLDGKLHPFC